MTIKVKHILLVILVIVITMLLYKFLNQPINELLTRKKYEKQIVSYMNFGSFDNVTDGSIEMYNYYKNYYNEPNIDISPLIESYIKQVETNNRNLYNSGGLAVELTSNIERTIEGGDYTNVTYLYYGENRKLLMEELENVLIHKGNDKYSGWCIRKDAPEIIDLPYNFYLKYEPSDFKLLDKVKKVTKCTFIDPVTYGHYRKRVKVEFVNENNLHNSIEGSIEVFDNGKLVLGLLGVYYSQTHNAKIELNNHYSDKIAEEWQRIHEDDFDDAYWDWDREDCKAIVDKFR